MPPVYNAALKTARMNAVLAAIDGGSGPGVLVIGTAALSGATGVLASITLQDPSGVVAGSVLTLSGMPLSDADADATGTAAKAEIRDSSGVVVVSGLTVGVSGADINLNSTAIAQHQIVTCSSATFTHG